MLQQMRAVGAWLAVSLTPPTAAERAFCAKMRSRFARHLEGGACLHISELFRLAEGEAASDDSREHLAHCGYCRELHARILRLL